MTLAAKDAIKVIHDIAPGFTAQLAIVLGSGLGALAEHIDDPVIIPYQDLPGFYQTTVEGHGGNLYLGKIHGVSVACLQGRAHYYEGVSNDVIKTMVRTLKLLGCNTWLATNAAGSLHSKTPPGSLVLLKDHINLQFNNVLVGENDSDFGPRFIGLEDAYDPDLRQQFLSLAKGAKIPLTEGVYISVIGPSFETPAEINAFRILGADVVGMSTVSEVIAARHCGMRVAVISVVTNLAAGMAQQVMSHDETLRGAKLATDKLIKLVLNFIQQYP